LEACWETLVDNWWGNNRSGYAPDGAWFHLIVDASACVDEEEFYDTILFDTSTWTEDSRLSDLSQLPYGEISFTANGERALVNFEFEATELRSFPGLELLQTFDTAVLEWPPPIARIAPDGEHFYLSFSTFGETRPGFWAVGVDSFLGWGVGGDGDAVFTPDGSVFALGGDSTDLWDPATATMLLSLPTSAQSAAASPLGSVAATASHGGNVELWTLDGATPIEPSSGTIGWLNPNWIIDGPRVAFRAFADPDSVFFIDPADGSVTYEFPALGGGDLLPDGRLAYAPLEFRPISPDPDDDLGWWEGPLMIRDPDDDSTEVLQDCVEYIGTNFLRGESAPGVPGEPVCPDGSPLFTTTVRVSRDGSLVAGMAVGGEVRIWDVETGDVVTTIDSGAEGGELRQFGDGWLMVDRPDADRAATLLVIDLASGDVFHAFPGSSFNGQVNQLSHDGSRLFLTGDDGRVLEYDTTAWSLVREWQGATSGSRGIAISPADSKLALSSGTEGLIAVWRIDGEEPELIESIPAAADRVSDIVWLGDDQLGAVLVPSMGRVLWQVIDLPSDVVVDKALDGLLRSFTATECATYRIDPCPTLDEMRSR
jgi:WD40 repeat protein